MIENRIKDKINILQKNIDDLKKYVDLEYWNNAIMSMEKKMENADFWNNQSEATKINRKLKIFKNRIKIFNRIYDDFNSLMELTEIAEDSTQNEIEDMTDTLVNAVDDFQTELLFTGEFDENDAILSIHPGAGGTESCDWADMLYRMYSKFFQKHGFKYQVIDYEPDSIAGLKNVAIAVSGDYAYGYLKSEIGIHRLVRISPFDSNSRRHTSFASVYVYPDIEKDIDFELDEKDLKIEAFRSSGPGGQNVNKLSTAIRITHIPTGIFAKSQTERSQYKNKTNAMKVLKAKVYFHYKELEEQKINAKLEKKKSIEWGSQIRSYVMYPYKMVKDLRTKYETSNVDSVMDGNIERFIKEFLIMNAKGTGGNGE